MIKIPEKEGRLSAAKAAHIEAVIAFVKRKTEGYRRDLFANISRVMTVSGTFEDMSARDDWSWLSDFILAENEGKVKKRLRKRERKFGCFLTGVK